MEFRLRRTLVKSWTLLLLFVLLLAPPRGAWAAQGSASSPHASTLDLAQELVEAERYDGARELLRRLLAQPLTDAERRSTEVLLARLPPSEEDMVATLELTAWQGWMWGYLLGPNLALLTWSPYDPSGLYLAGASSGFVLGTGSTLGLAWLRGLTAGQARTVLVGEQLGLLLGAGVGGTVVPGEEGRAGGMLAGAAVGTGLGWWVSQRDPSSRAMLGASSGVYWGAGLGLLGLLAGEQLTDDVDDWLLPLGVVTTLGVSGGYFLVEVADLSRDAIHAANLGGAVGTAGGFLVVGMVALDRSVENAFVSGLPMATGLAGGAVGIWLERRARRRVGTARGPSGERGGQAWSLAPAWFDNGGERGPTIRLTWRQP